MTGGNKANLNVIANTWLTPFKGWLVVLGDVNFAGNFGGIQGVLYAQGMVTSSGMGTSQVEGLTVVENLLGGSSFTPGNSKFIFNCTYAKGNQESPAGWFLRSGSYCDNPSGCP